MATRTIQSPGVEIREIDLTQRAPSQVGTDVFIMGFSDRGPSDEILNLGEISDFEQIYGLPTNAAERYFYHTVKQTFNSDANVYVSRLPYGDEDGLSDANNVYTALAYGVDSYALTPLDTTTLTAATVTTVTLDFASANVNEGSLAVGSYTEDKKIGILVKYTENGGSTKVLESVFVTSDVTVVSAAGSNWAKQYSVKASEQAALTKLLSPLRGSGVTINSAKGITLEDSGDAAGPKVPPKSNTSSGDYHIIGSPTLVPLTETEYVKWKNGEETFDNDSTSNATFTDSASLDSAGIIILNKAKTTINTEFEGYYVGISDGANNNPATDFDCILGQKTTTSDVSASVSQAQMKSIPTSRLDYSLSADFTSNAQNVSRTLEEATEYNITDAAFGDTITIGIIKTRITPFTTGDNKLSYILAESYTGSVNSFRKVQNPNGGQRLSFFLEDQDDNSPNVQILINPNISKNNGSWTATDGDYTTQDIRVGGTNSSTIASFLLNSTDNTNVLNPLGGYSPNKAYYAGKKIGSIPKKINRIFQIADNVDLFNIDVSVEGGLGTIFVGSKYSSDTSLNTANQFDDTAFVNIGDKTTGTGFYTLKDQFDESATNATSVRDDYRSVFNAFEQFARQTRKDHIFIADPLRYTVVQGENNKILNNKANNFSQHVYWPLRHNFAVANSNYATTYGNWIKVYDGTADKQIWAPFSGNAAAMYARTDANFAPWFAPAGYTRGVVVGANDIAISPTQRQRDQLYRVNINPITQFPQEGIVVFGQKTLQKRPTAFDRVNVRRLFLNLEKRTRNTIKYFLFEPNTFITRNKIVNTLRPIFERAKQTEGVYDYLIVCDERNNTADVINNNELVVDIYLKPVRAAEFILVNFFAVNNDVNFEELINR